MNLTEKDKNRIIELIKNGEKMCRDKNAAEIVDRAIEEMRKGE